MPSLFPLQLPPQLCLKSAVPSCSVASPCLYAPIHSLQGGSLGLLHHGGRRFPFLPQASSAPDPQPQLQSATGALAVMSQAQICSPAQETAVPWKPSALSPGF